MEKTYRKIKEQILELRNQGKSYGQIAEILKCSKGAISYHLGKGQKEKSKIRGKKNREESLLTIIGRKVDHFKKIAKTKSPIPKPTYLNEKLLMSKIYTFNDNLGNIPFSSEDVLNKFGQLTKCYLTGDPINLMEPRKYQFDHIIPKSRGGSNSLDNLGITTKEANQCKRDLTLPEFLQLCEKVLVNNGYGVSKPIE